MCIYIFFFQWGGAIVLTENSRRENKTYRALQIDYTALVDTDRLPEDTSGFTLGSIIDIVRQLFATLIARVTTNLEPQDLIRMIIISDQLDRPISTTLSRVSDFTVETILSRIQTVLQSKDTIVLDEGFTVNVTVVKRPVGSGRNRKAINPEVDRLTKGSITSIRKDSDGVCCAMAILLGKANHDNDPDLPTLRHQKCNMLMRRAYALHAATGVPVGPCGLPEIAVFERHLDVQVIVISTKHKNEVR